MSTTPTANAKGIIEEVNILRSDPKKYSDKLERYKTYFTDDIIQIPEIDVQVSTQEGVVPYTETIEYLKKQEPVEQLTASRALCEIAQEILDKVVDSETGEIEESLVEKIIDSQSILKSPEFSVTLANNSVVNGTVQRIDGEWKVEFTTKGDTSIETLYDKLNEYERNGELSDQDIEYFKYRLNQIKNKTAPNPQYTLYSIQLMSRIKANPESAESRFYRELTNYNEKCNI